MRHFAKALGCNLPKQASSIALLDAELGKMGSSEMWQAGAAVRKLRPKEKARTVTSRTKGVAGRKRN